jgi:four helix bundle protein
MPTFERIEEIEAWRRARELCGKIYRESGKGVFAKDFGLRDQMQRASVSIMSKFAEGFERSGSGEFVQLLAVAKGFAGEVRNQLYIALDQIYLAREDISRLSQSATDTARIVVGLINYLRKAGVNGTTYTIHHTRNLQHGT